MMVRGTEFFVFYFFCVALGLIISGLYLIIKRFLLRHNGTPVTIVSILPRVTKEIPFRVIGADRYIYGYDIKYMTITIEYGAVSIVLGGLVLLSLF